MPENNSLYGIQQRVQDNAEQRDRPLQEPIVEVITPDVYNNYRADGSSGPFSGIWSRILRIKITGRDGSAKLDVKIPVSHLIYSTRPVLCCYIYIMIHFIHLFLL